MVAATLVVALLLASLFARWWVKRRLPPISKVGKALVSWSAWLRCDTCVGFPDAGHASVLLNGCLCWLCAGLGRVLPPIC